MNCIIHNDREAAGICVNCGKPHCDECLVEVNGKMYCKKCVADIAGAPQQPTYLPPPKSKSVAVLLCLFLGMLGIHRIYLGKYGTALAYMLCSTILFWTYIAPLAIAFCSLADLITILQNKFYDAYDRPLV